MFVEEKVEVKTLTHSSRRQVLVGEKVEVKTLDTQLQATGVCGGEGGGEDIGHTAPGDRCLWERRWR